MHTSVKLMMLAKNRGGYCEKKRMRVHFHVICWPSQSLSFYKL